MSQAPEPAPRRPLHLRRISCQAFERDDGLLDVEGFLVDTRTRSITLLDKREIPAGEVIHQMRVRLTVDLQRTIQDASVYSEIHPYPECPAVEAAYRQLIGMRIDPGFTREVKRLFKGVKGCSHMSEIIPPWQPPFFRLCGLKVISRVQTPQEVISGTHPWATVMPCGLMDRSFKCT